MLVIHSSPSLPRAGKCQGTISAPSADRDVVACVRDPQCSGSSARQCRIEASASQGSDTRAVGSGSEHNRSVICTTQTAGGTPMAGMY
jgi:hypothetical protein